MLRQNFANNLKKIRKSRKLTQEQLAELVDVDFRYISFLENAKSFPSCDLIERLSDALNVKYSELFDIQEDISRKEIEASLINLIKSLSDKNLEIVYKIVKDLI